jgi:hypothetical protein
MNPSCACKLEGGAIGTKFASGGLIPTTSPWVGITGGPTPRSITVGGGCAAYPFWGMGSCDSDGIRTRFEECLPDGLLGRVGGAVGGLEGRTYGWFD